MGLINNPRSLSSPDRRVVYAAFSFLRKLSATNVSCISAPDSHKMPEMQAVRDWDSSVAKCSGNALY